MRSKAGRTGPRRRTPSWPALDADGGRGTHQKKHARGEVHTATHGRETNPYVRTHVDFAVSLVKPPWSSAQPPIMPPPTSPKMVPPTSSARGHSGHMLLTRSASTWALCRGS